MNGQTVTTQDLLSEINTMESSLSELKKKVLSFLPPKYGSDAWWEQETAKSLEDYKNGNYVEVKNKKELHVFLSDLKK